MQLQNKMMSGIRLIEKGIRVDTDGKTLNKRNSVSPSEWTPVLNIGGESIGDKKFEKSASREVLGSKVLLMDGVKDGDSIKSPFSTKKLKNEVSPKYNKNAISNMPSPFKNKEVIALSPKNISKGSLESSRVTLVSRGPNRDFLQENIAAL